MLYVTVSKGIQNQNHLTRYEQETNLVLVVCDRLKWDAGNSCHQAHSGQGQVAAAHLDAHHVHLDAHHLDIWISMSIIYFDNQMIEKYSTAMCYVATHHVAFFDISQLLHISMPLLYR